MRLSYSMNRSHVEPDLGYETTKPSLVPRWRYRDRMTSRLNTRFRNQASRRRFDSRFSRSFTSHRGDRERSLTSVRLLGARPIGHPVPVVKVGANPPHIVA